LYSLYLSQGKEEEEDEEEDGKRGWREREG